MNRFRIGMKKVCMSLFKWRAIKLLIHLLVGVGYLRPSADFLRMTGNVDAAQRKVVLRGGSQQSPIAE
jgi:hypothetical protein